MIDTTELNILILVCLTLTFSQGHVDARKGDKYMPIISKSYEWI